MNFKVQQDATHAGDCEKVGSFTENLQVPVGLGGSSQLTGNWVLSLPLQDVDVPGEGSGDWLRCHCGSRQVL